ncbi:protein-disulfide reductase DsbD, partial [Pseudidiomarina aestuarii]
AICLIVSGYRELKRSAAHVFAIIWIVLGIALQHYFWPTTYHQADFVAVDSVAGIEAELDSAGDQVVMLDLYADWCVACKEFERETFGDEDVQVAFDQMRILQADVTANNATNQAIWQKYRVLGLPTIIFFYDGEEIPGSRVTGFMPADDFLQHIENCCEKR